MADEKVSEFERMLIRSADQALAIARGELAPARIETRELSARDVEISPPPAFDAERVLLLRKAMRLSQSVFADVLNVSPALVRAWEQGARQPEGAPLRLLQLAELNPRMVEDLALARWKRALPPQLYGETKGSTSHMAVHEGKPGAASVGPRTISRGGVTVGKKPVFTSPNPKGKGWVVQQGGEVISKHRTKDPAINAGRREAMKDHTEHAIQNKNGQIVKKNSYGNDPNPPRDKNR